MSTKKMTVLEKQLPAEVRAELRQKGILPAKKKPLNRKRFIAEARDILKMDTNGYGFELYLHWALCEMMSHTGYNSFAPDLEAVGAAKVIHLAKRRMDFETSRMAKSKETWTVGEMCEAVMDIYKA